MERKVKVEVPGKMAGSSLSILRRMALNKLLPELRDEAEKFQCEPQGSWAAC